MASGNDMKAHEQTYGGVMSMLKWGTIGCFLLGMFVVVAISS
jgi:Bacterial aa3 type cytochrome c oxidase subunit IV